jgi:hypothetical protein
MDRLSLAVGRHESGNCTRGHSVRTNNCHGLGGDTHPFEYETTAASYEAFKALWTRAYGGFPTAKTATKYVKGPNYVGPPACSWLKSVSRNYNNGL